MIISKINQLVYVNKHKNLDKEIYSHKTLHSLSELTEDEEPRKIL